MYKTFAKLLQLWGLNSVVLGSSSETRQGPISLKRPNIDVPPGPLQ